MANFMDIISFRDRGEGQKPYAAKIGSAKMRDDGGVDLYFDALPAPSIDRNGKLQIHVRVSERREQGGGTQQRPQRQVPPPQDDMEDSIPF